MNLSTFYENKVILVTGGTGTIGSEIVSQILQYNPKVIRVFSNSENELWETKNKLLKYKNKLRFLLGDIRNLERVKRATDGVDYIFNAAAIKHVPISEYNPMEAITVNIIGLNNIIEAALIYNVKKIIHISTDKSVLPTTVMGATKMLGERLCISRNWAKGKHPLIISAVRFGNVLGSFGSVIPLFQKQISNGGPVTITHKEMKRFFMTIPEAVKLILEAAKIGQGNEIFVLDMGDPIKLIDIAKRLIKLSGYKPEEDIAIEIVGNWDLPEEDFADAVNDQAMLMAGVNHDELPERHSDIN